VPAGSVCDAIAANFDFLPTFVRLAGGTVPSDRILDGRDITPLLFGQTQTSPHEALYYFNRETLKAVRSGAWKLAVARQSESMGGSGHNSQVEEPFAPTLYNLDADIGEQTNVASAHPKIVKRLQALAARMDADLGATNDGPGVRPSGRVEDPVGLWLPGARPQPGAASTE
jgi:arylsulfatase A-like enzyme